MARAGRHHHCEPGLHGRSHAIDDGLTRTLLDPEELIDVVDLHANLFPWPQGHHHKLAVVRGVENPAKFAVVDRNLLDVLHKAFHDPPAFVLQIFSIGSARAPCV